jgi:hypothetical protein
MLAKPGYLPLLRWSKPNWSDSMRKSATASSSSATMLVILIIGFTAGPAVSL